MGQGVPRISSQQRRTVAVSPLEVVDRQHERLAVPQWPGVREGRKTHAASILEGPAEPHWRGAGGGINRFGPA